MRVVLEGVAMKRIPVFVPVHLTHDGEMRVVVHDERKQLPDRR